MDFIVDFLIDYYGPIPYLAIFFILLGCGLGVPIPEDITLIAAGILTYYGVCDVWTMIGVCLLGVLVGDSFMFWLGHHYGRKLIKRWPFRAFIDETKINGIRSKLKNHGGKLLFTARFMPGLRSTVFFASGMLHFPYRKLLIYDGAAALISVPAIVYSIYYFGDFLEHVIKLIKKVEGGIAGVIVAVLAFFIVKYWLNHRKKVTKA
ncbi:MAG: DedA family protein [Bdellovibrionales bacterium]|nr:DedA family protein [Oligoflexia bacterium]